MHHSFKLGRFGHTRLVAGATALLLGASGCGSASDGNLFSHEGVRRGDAGGAGLDVAANQAGRGGSGASGFGAASAGNASGGSGPQVGDAASGGVESGGADNGSAAATASGGSTSSQCVAYGADARYFPQTQHCYLVVRDLSTFADAQAHCAALGAHLVTLANEPENSFAWSLSMDEHWIGATDGKGPKEPQAGNYLWVTGEPFSYQDWAGGQPNASHTDCDDHSGGAECVEHCAFQWAGGAWNDRYCLHTIQSICEWERQSGTP